MLGVEFANKEYLLLLLLAIPYILWYVLYRKKSEPTMRMADTSAFRFAPRSWKVLLMPVLPVLRLITFALVVLALARPQTHNSWKTESVEGIDIMLALDVSTSMLAIDMGEGPDRNKNRLEVAKEVAEEFIASRPNDNIGLTIFAGESFTQCPMTVDHASLLKMLRDVRTDIAATGVIEDGTAIGMGLATSVGHLKNDSTVKTHVVILLTDGSNNRGDISPMTAAEMASRLGIRVYTIGVGANGTARYPMTVGGMTQYVTMPVEIDTETLKRIATATNGLFFRATNASELRDFYHEIDQLEKSKMDVRHYSRRYEAYQPLVMLAVLTLLLEILLRITLFRRIP